MLFKRWYIKFCRYVLGKKFLPVMAGWLKGYQWTTERDYEYLLGNYEDPEVLNEIISWFRRETVFYDIGANVGYYSFLANQFIKEGEIVAFEPVPANISIFEKHLELNKARVRAANITLLPFAIGNAEKKIEFSNSSKHVDGNTYINSSPVYKQARSMITVQCYSVDELIDQGYPVPGVIKIDVEGAEFDALKGAAKTIRKYKPHIVLATHDCHLPGVKQDCVQFLHDAGYELKHTGRHNKHIEGLDDFIATHPSL